MEITRGDYTIAFDGKSYLTITHRQTFQCWTGDVHKNTHSLPTHIINYGLVKVVKKALKNKKNYKFNFSVEKLNAQIKNGSIPLCYNIDLIEKPMSEVELLKKQIESMQKKFYHVDQKIEDNRRQALRMNSDRIMTIDNLTARFNKLIDTATRYVTIFCIVLAVLAVSVIYIFKFYVSPN